MEELRTYEFACHITTLLDEAKVPAVWDEVQQLIAKQGGTVVASQSPQPSRLSYPIKHQTKSLFAWAQFTAEPGQILSELDEWARLHPEVLRHVTLKLDVESDKRAIRQAAHLERKAAKQAKETSAAVQKKTVAETKSTDSGKLEQQIEDVLETL